MLKSKKLPKEFWAEAVQCAIYVQNRCPHVSLEDKTPQEAWSGRKPTVSHLKVFGSMAYAHVPDQRRTKLEDKSKKFVFIGYDEKTKSFKLLDPINKKVMVSRDVKVASEWDWKNSSEMIVERGESSTNTTTISQSERSPQTTDDEEEPRKMKMRSLRDLYESTSEVHLICFLADTENISFEEAVKSEKWQAAMNDEIKSIEKNETWELAELPRDTRALELSGYSRKR